jgi:hypothetical protein
VKIIYVEKMSFVLIYDLPREFTTERKQLNLKLKRANAKKIQHSFWKHDDINMLIKIAIWIRNIGGKAEILEERFLF